MSSALTTSALPIVRRLCSVRTMAVIKQSMQLGGYGWDKYAHEWVEHNLYDPYDLDWEEYNHCGHYDYEWSEYGHSSTGSPLPTDWTVLHLCV